MNSVQLRSEKRQGGGILGGDDTATNNVRMMCTDGEVLDVEGPVWGEWLSYATCPADSAISGVRLQIERDQGGGDDSSVNKIELMCTDTKLESQGEQLCEKIDSKVTSIGPQLGVLRQNHFFDLTHETSATG